MIYARAQCLLSKDERTLGTRLATSEFDPKPTLLGRDLRSSILIFIAQYPIWAERVLLTRYNSTQYRFHTVNDYYDALSYRQPCEAQERRRIERSIVDVANQSRNLFSFVHDEAPSFGITGK
jgi:hypothetical protein